MVKKKLLGKLSQNPGAYENTLPMKMTYDKLLLRMQINCSFLSVLLVGFPNSLKIVPRYKCFQWFIIIGIVCYELEWIPTNIFELYLMKTFNIHRSLHSPESNIALYINLHSARTIICTLLLPLATRDDICDLITFVIFLLFLYTCFSFLF